MYIQVISGTTDDEAGIRRLGSRWEAELSDTPGWLGTTAGYSPQHRTFLIVVRFAEKAAARASARRAEHRAWWEELVKHFDDPPAVDDYTDETLYLGGGDDHAGFVQLMRGHTSDRGALEVIGRELNASLDRPDILGGLFAWHAEDHDRFLDVVYFTSEEDARAGETQMSDLLQRWVELTSDLEFFDIPQPRLISAE